MDSCVARQPIFDRKRHLYAYQLLFRSGPESYFGSPAAGDPAVPGDRLLDVPQLADGKTAFVHFSRSTLLGGLALVLAPEEIVVELSSSVVADDEVLEACRQLKRAGYRIALDGFVEGDHSTPLLRYADFVKVDATATKPDDRDRLVREIAPAEITLLAENVDTWELLGQVASSGYRYFQGYFFSKPVAVSARAIPGFRLNYLRLIEELSHPTNIDRLERVVKQEASIAYRLLRRVNSLAFGFRTEVRSLRHALVLLGEHELRTSAMVWVLAEIGQESPDGLVVASTLRARICELVAESTDGRMSPPELFLVGLFSMLDAIMERPIEQAIANLPLAPEVRDALMGKPGLPKAVLDAVMAYERGGWGLASDLARTAGLDEQALASAYLKAVKWTGEVFHQPHE